MAIPDTRKKLGVPVFVLLEIEVETTVFAGFVCVSIPSRRVHYTKPLQQKSVSGIFFQKPPEPS